MKHKADEDYEIGKAIGKAEAAEDMKAQIVPKKLAEYSDGLPFQKERVFNEIEFLAMHETRALQNVVMARVDIGKRLILLHEMAGVPVLHGGDRKTEEFQVRQADLKKELEERFPWLSKQKKSEYMTIAKAVVENPGKFQQWLTGGQNWKKALILVSNLDRKDIKALDSGEEVGGVTLDEFDAMTREELKERCLRQSKQIRRGKEQLEEKEEEIERLKREKAGKYSELPSEEQEALEVLYKVQQDFVSAISTIRQKVPYDKAPATALRQLYFLYIFVGKVAMEERLALNEVYRDAEEVPWEISEDEIPPADVLIDNLPMSAGKGLGKKIKEKTEGKK